MKRIACTSILASVLVVLTTPTRAADTTGKEVFDHYCSYCHGSSDGPGTMQLRRTRGKDQALLTERTNLSPDYIEYVVRHGLKSMPPFAPSDLTEAKLKVLAAFLAKK
jgi:mono/diheme cytochrome c family protein